MTSTIQMRGLRQSLTVFLLQAEQEETIECISDAVSSLPSLLRPGVLQTLGGNDTRTSACERSLTQTVLGDMQKLVERLRHLHAKTMSSFTGDGLLPRTNIKGRSEYSQCAHPSESI